jgi:hypothetical protein
MDSTPILPSVIRTKFRLNTLFLDVPQLRVGWIRSLNLLKDEDLAAFDIYDARLIRRSRAEWLNLQIQDKNSYSDHVKDMLFKSITAGCARVAQIPIDTIDGTSRPNDDVSHPEDQDGNMDYDDIAEVTPPPTEKRKKEDDVAPNQEKDTTKRPRRNRTSKKPPQKSIRSRYRDKYYIPEEAPAKTCIAKKPIVKTNLVRPEPLKPGLDERYPLKNYGAVMHTVQGMTPTTTVAGFIGSDDEKLFFPTEFTRTSQRTPALHEPTECKLCAHISKRIPRGLCNGPDHMTICMIYHAAINYSLTTAQALDGLEFETPVKPDLTIPVEKWFVRREDRV